VTRSKRLAVLAHAVVAAIFLPGIAQAGLLGDTVFVRWAHPNFASSFSGPEAAVVGVGTEINCPGAYTLCSGYGSGDVDIDFGDLSITHTHNYGPGTYAATAYNGFAYTSLNVGGAGITGFNLFTNIAGLDVSRVSFGIDFININVASLDFDRGSYYTLELVSGAGSAVPEPATGLLLAGGLAAMLRRRARRA